MRYSPPVTLLVDPCTGRAYAGSDDSCPLKSIGMVATGANCWANTQVKREGAAALIAGVACIPASPPIPAGLLRAVAPELGPCGRALLGAAVGPRRQRHGRGPPLT